MVICKFFQQGNCRYGQSCRFDHIYGSKYSYQAPTAVQSAPVGVTDEQLINQVQSDVQSTLKGGQWILSCYSPFKEKPNFPGMSDLSMEEARLFIYEAKTNNNLDQAIAYMNNLYSEMKNKYEQLLYPSQQIISVFRSLYKGEMVPSPFTSNVPNSNAVSNPATSIFRSAVQSTTPFGQNANSNSIFGAAPAVNNPGQNIFGQTQNAPSIFDQPPNIGTNADSSAKSLFSQATHNIFGQNSTPASSIFATQPVSNAFDKTNTPTAQSIFGQANQNIFKVNETPSSFPTGPQTSPFTQQNSQSPFGNVFQSQGKQDANDNNIYSDPNSMMESDMDSFKAEDFKLGFIPETPPPHSVCF